MYLKIAQNFRQQADAIETDNRLWNQGFSLRMLEDGNIARCLKDRIDLAANNPSVDTTAGIVRTVYGAVYAALGMTRTHEHYVKEIPDWNDAPERKASEVVAVMRKTADLLEIVAVEHGEMLPHGEPIPRERALVCV